jgi:mannosyl-oligosaccharide alpha-1,2-mannosidase
MIVVCSSVIQGFKDEFKEAVAAASKLDLASAKIETINVFETTIRHLGGFLACYDLSEDKRCLAKAIEFGDMLYKAFDTPNRMPITRWNPVKSLRDEQKADPTVLVAEIGSLALEFTRLYLITHDPKYYDATHRITRQFSKQQMDTHIPGMWPVIVNAEKPDFAEDTFFTLGAMSDSLYEVRDRLKDVHRTY